ncbi:cytochrome PufQ [Pseudooctadecabacter jejudonensis]|uniref:PufQ cytochrome subunit n=1 Tax=Pseudooctadecabacter jejudonensis TaxID=1391910 RepID=A0A1Y5S6Q5_9RHOB|nr:cytochrome PufQ [Pseudooctadecabacter jejudonensis]SLN32819.1 PufQ cytochrome subunit [Pseudooctadecabacter jejudonensis]
MTDLTTDTPIEAKQSRNTNAEKREYGAYFVVIFFACLPLALFTYVLFALRNFRLPEKDPVQTAWSQAGIITPMIFHP